MEGRPTADEERSGRRVRSFEDLEVWQRGIALAEALYHVTRSFPREELHGLAGQLRAAVSVPSNIAEGWGRGAGRDFVRFLTIARGSLYEVRSQLVIARRVGYLEEADLLALRRDIAALSRMLLGLMRSVERRNTSR